MCGGCRQALKGESAMSGTVSLKKQQSISLSKQSPSLSKIHFGVGWDPVEAEKPTGLLGRLFGGGSSSGGDIDLDASLILMDKSGDVLDTIWFRQKESRCGAVRHSGDNLTGEGDGDDEVINVELGKLRDNVEHLCFTVNSFRGQTFNEVGGASCRVLDQHDKPLAEFALSEKGSHTGILIASISRNGGEWKMTAHGTPMPGRTINDMIPAIIAELIQ